MKVILNTDITLEARKVCYEYNGGTYNVSLFFDRSKYILEDVVELITMENALDTITVKTEHEGEETVDTYTGFTEIFYAAYNAEDVYQYNEICIVLRRPEVPAVEETTVTE